MAEPSGPVVQECVEGYLYARPPLRLLIFRRPPSRGRIWVPISGKVDPTDRDLEAALRRETAEETGLTAPVSVRDLDWHRRFLSERGEVWRLHAFAVEVRSSFEPRLSDEHEAAEWVDPAEAKRRLHFDDNRAAVDRLRDFLASDPAPNA